MPRIRKKTSKRGTTHQREKLKHKVPQGRKKAKKEVQNTQDAGITHKKSKKDLGIPNIFPTRIKCSRKSQSHDAAEEKQRRKDETRAALAGLEEH
ncbi:uncharacterized protein F5147DRAFT_767353 [Suillus discolor]|uniref:Guanine nucleotide-binding protein-like 3 N-terminal domain-containing protein n=1 Tax=Suillus discolor TaxID=1912936 RepID=A0A9P7FKN5_9AGAM|nr:uncharacterized protein F5147DRAFT_767353 [Suillus discolor]KAG2119892.1 hypothetical protein F5147DRAFT_767353 [Suillus discolor]